MSVKSERPAGAAQGKLGIYFFLSTKWLTLILSHLLAQKEAVSAKTFLVKLDNPMKICIPGCLGEAWWIDNSYGHSKS